MERGLGVVYDRNNKKIGVVKMDIKNTVKSSIKNLDKYPNGLLVSINLCWEKAIERVKKELKLRQKDMSILLMMKWSHCC